MADTHRKMFLSAEALARHAGVQRGCRGLSTQEAAVG